MFTEGHDWEHRLEEIGFDWENTIVALGHLPVFNRVSAHEWQPIPETMEQP
jgi:hypothetical protein